jgi:hypothetical protein
MRALLILTLSLLSLPTLSRSQQWSIEYDRGLAPKQNGNLSIDLFGNRVFSHAFREPARAIFPRRIDTSATIELVITVSESEGAEWGGNPSGESIELVPANIGLIVQNDWSTASGRWYSVVRLPLTPGTHRLSVPLASWAWVNVFGKFPTTSAKHREQWVDSLTEPSRIGVCAGGFFRGHGVEMLFGSGNIRVLVLRVND